jgi:hypothetical protein
MSSIVISCLYLNLFLLHLSWFLTSYPKHSQAASLATAHLGTGILYVIPYAAMVTQHTEKLIINGSGSEYMRDNGLPARCVYFLLYMYVCMYAYMFTSY